MKHIARASMVSPTRHHLTWFQLVQLAKKKIIKFKSCNHHDSPSLHGKGIVLASTWSWWVLVLINSFGESLASFSSERQEGGF